MGKNSATYILIGLLVISTMATVGFSFIYMRRIGEFRSLQYQATVVETKQNGIRALANDVLEYSKQNPAIDPMLQSMGLKPKSAVTSPKVK